MWRKLFGVGELSSAKFADLVVEVGVTNGAFLEPVIDYEAMTITERSRMVNLGNLYPAFLRLPRRERMTFIINALAMPEVPEGWDEAKAQLMPVLRDGAYLVLTELTMRARFSDDADAEPKNIIARRPLVAGLFRTLVIDSPSTMSLVSDSHLEEWGVDFDTAFEVALSNLRAKSQDAFRQLAPGLWAAPWSDSFAAARALLPEILQRVCTDPLVCVPNRDTLIVADPQRPDSFTGMVALVEKVAEDELYPITRTIYQLENKTLRLFVPPADPPATRAIYDKLRLHEQVRCYNDEKELRDQIDEEAFYGTLMAYELEDKSVISRAIWTEGCDPCYLPPAQTIHFVKLGDEPTVHTMWDVPWNVVLETHGMLTMTDAPLPRWRIGTFPSDAWLDKHGKRLGHRAD